MKHPIDPKIDCVFKALLGGTRKPRLLIHFRTAILTGELPAPVVEVAIRNPYKECEFLGDKLSIVDVKAQDQAGRLYQIEIQLLNIPDLPARILYGWADLYSAQLQDGDGYDQLQPTYAIWLLGQTLRPQVAEAIHRFRLRDEQGRSLVEHGGIWLLELSKCTIEMALGTVPEDDIQYLLDLGLCRMDAGQGLTIANPLYRKVLPRALAFTP